MQKKGLVYLVGAGPGDPGLFTVKGVECLKKAEVVVYDRLVNPKILEYINPGAELIYVGKASSDHTLTQDGINQVLADEAVKGKVVVRLKGGDPVVFGRGGEEALFLHERGISFEIVPGITSAIAVPAYAGIPVTHREMTSTLAVITGHERPDKKESSIQWDKIATGIGTLVFLMGVENLGFIVRNLLAHGRAPTTPCALIRWGTLPKQEVLTGTLENIETKVREAKFAPPAIIVVGEVVELRDQLNWFENKPLFGKSIVVTRSRAQASQLSAMIEALGGEAIEVPTIIIVPNADMSALHHTFERLESFNWLLFTSVNGVKIFLTELVKSGRDIRDLKGMRIGAIGPATRDALKNMGLVVEFVPEEYRAEGIIQVLEGQINSGDKVLLPRARGARSVLPRMLREWGADVTEVELYEAKTGQIKPGYRDMIMQGKVDAITFTSSSTVHNFVKIIGEEHIENINRTTKIACIGPITADTAIGRGFTVDVIADEYTIPGLVDALVKMFSQRNPVK